MFVKLFTQILDSSIADDRRLRHFFTDILLCSDAQGFVMMTEAAIARRIGTTTDEVKWGIAELMKPDPRSKTPDHEGRRLETVVGSGYGWRIINFEAYKALRSAEDMREKTRERVRRFRDKQRDSDECNAHVTPCNAGNAIQSKSKSKSNTPLPPKGGLVGDLPKKPKRHKRLTSTEKRTTKIPANTPAMISIGAWFGRQESTLWTITEAESLARCNPSEKELAGMEGYYLADHGDKDYRRTSVITLLNNWQSELDRAREWWKKST